MNELKMLHKNITFLPSADIYIQYLRVQYIACKNDTEPAIKGKYTLFL